MYVKLFSSLVRSSIWVESKDTKILWITMLALADKEGYVFGAVPGIAHIAGITLDEALVSFKALESPDPYSSDTNNEGRRIEKVNHGWKILNYSKYRDTTDNDYRRNRERAKKASQRGGDKTGQRRNVPQNVQMSPHTDTDTDTEAEASSSSLPSPSPILRRRTTRTGRPADFGVVAGFFNDRGIPLTEAQKFWDYYDANGWVQGQGKPIVKWEAAARGWIVRWKETGGRATPKRRVADAFVPAPIPASYDKSLSAKAEEEAYARITRLAQQAQQRAEENPIEPAAGPQAQAETVSTPR